MKKLLSVLSLSIVLMIFAVACSTDSANHTAEVRAIGSYVTSSSRAIESSPPGGFASGSISVNGNAVELKPKNTQSGNANNVEFSAIVTDVPEKITLSVSPNAGFIFDEWELDKSELRRDNVSRRKIRELKAILDDDADENENLVVNAEDAKYFIATFDRGYYIDNSKTEKGNGTKESPYNSFTAADIKGQNRDQDELTLKLAVSDSPYSFDDLVLPLAVEEFKIIGGYSSSDWSSSASGKTSLTELPVNLSIEELELRDVSIENLDAAIASDESEFTNVEIGTLTINGQIVSNVIADNVIGSGTFVNSVVKNYSAGSTYYHSIVYGFTGSTFNGENNILIYEDGEQPEKVGKNIWVKNSEIDSNKRYLLSNPDSIQDLKNADPVRTVDDDLEDYLEEDILSRDRAESDDHGLKVSYGPYEYNEYLDD